MKFNQYWLVAFGIAFAAMFPSLAHSKPVDPIADIIGERTGWDAPAPTRLVAKPKTASSVRLSPTPVVQPVPADVHKDAAEAEKVARKFTFALTFSR